MRRAEAVSRSTEAVQGSLHPSILRARGASGFCPIRAAPWSVSAPFSGHGTLPSSTMLLQIVIGAIWGWDVYFMGKIFPPVGVLRLLTWWE